MFSTVIIMFFELLYYYIIVTQVIKINQISLSHLNDQMFLIKRNFIKQTRKVFKPKLHTRKLKDNDVVQDFKETLYNRLKVIEI